VSSSIEQSRRDVHKAFEAILAVADSSKSRSLWAVERELWTLILALGRVTISLFLARQVSRERDEKYEHKGVRYVLRGTRTSPLNTRFGRVSFTRPIGRRPSALKRAADLIVDRELGLGSGFSLGVTLGIVRLYAQMSFANALELYREIYEWAPSPRAAMRMVDAVGKRARAFIEQAPAPKDDGEILVLQVDGGGAPMIGEAEYQRRRQPKTKPKDEKGTRRGARKKRRQNEPKKRRAPGKKSKNAKVAFVAVIYTLAKTPDGLEGPINKRVIGTFESHRALFDWLKVEAIKRGYGKKKTLFIADGSDHIWKLQQEYFPDAEACLDWYHLAEYLWTAGRSVHPNVPKYLKEWVGEQKEQLRAGEIAAVIKELSERLAAIPKTGPGNKGKRERLTTALRYFEKHKKRMPYAAFIADDFDIGSGAVEGAIRNVVRMRLDGPGMRWGRRRAEWILHLRCILVSGQWQEFTDELVLEEVVQLAAQPVLTQPHVARPRGVAA